MRYYVGGVDECACERAREWLEGCGHEVVCGAQVVKALPSSLGFGEAMGVRFELVGLCEAVFMVDGWKESQVARAEYHYAKGLGKEIHFESKQWAMRKERGNEEV